MQPLGKDVTHKLGKIIRQRRGYYHWTQDDLAKRAFVHYKTISNIERGVVTAGFGDVVGILRALDLDVVIVERPHEPIPDL